MTDMILPEGWVEARLNSLGKIVTGKTPTKKNINNFGGDIPFIKPSDLNQGGYINTTVETLTINGLQEVISIPKYSLLVTCIGNLGKIGITTSDLSVTNQQINSIIPVKSVSYKYLYFYLRTIQAWLKKESSATTISIINKTKFSKAPVLLAPFAEQEEIAQRVDRAIGHVDELKSRLETLLTTLKTFRQSVLNAAVTGKLTENWNVSSKTRNIELLSQIGCLERGKSKHRPRNDIRLFGNKYPFIQTGEIAQANEIVTEATKFYSDFGLQQSKLFSKGTLCITIAANIADTAILGINACFPDSIVGFTPDLSKCCVKYVKYFIDINKENLERFAPATAQKNINLKILNLLEISLPPLEEQEEIVKRVEAYFALADQIEKQVQSALDKVNLLTQSILAKAFRGELTKEWRQKNPELISGENSAEALLKRIKAEKDALEKPSKKTKNTKVKVT